MEYLQTIPLDFWITLATVVITLILGQLSKKFELVAKKKNFIYVDTGAMYRALALFCSRNGIAPEDEEKVIENCGKYA